MSPLLGKGPGLCPSSVLRPIVAIAGITSDCRENEFYLHVLQIAEKGLSNWVCIERIGDGAPECLHDRWGCGKCSVLRLLLQSVSTRFAHFRTWHSSF